MTTPRKGLVLAGGSGTRLYPLTLAVSKQLLPVHDKPMVYYPLSALMLAGIREILVIVLPRDLPLFERLLGDGSGLGLRIAYAVQPAPEGLAQAFLLGADFLGGAPSCLVLGDNLFHGADFAAKIAAAASRSEGATFFATRVADPRAYGVAEFDAAGRVVSLEEKPAAPKSPFAVTGIYFCDRHAADYARALRPSARGELEILDVGRRYLEAGTLRVETLSRGTAWFDTGTHESLREAGEFVAAVQGRQGLRIACLEEIAFHRGWIGREQLRERARLHGQSSYAAYLHQLADAA